MCFFYWCRIWMYKMFIFIMYNLKFWYKMNFRVLMGKKDRTWKHFVTQPWLLFNFVTFLTILLKHWIVFCYFLHHFYDVWIWFLHCVLMFEFYFLIYCFSFIFVYIYFILSHQNGSYALNRLGSTPRPGRKFHPALHLALI
jgi:hypothetical protein